MIRRLVSNPAALVLLALVVLGALGVLWGIGVSAVDQGFSYEGQPSSEQLWQMRVIRIANFVPGPATFVSIASLLGLLAIASASRPRNVPPELRS
ncbi:hypothetical protein [Agromyces sp. CCNWLW203]|uniref:hypothetical protein n=1 Tax=Agromyces sp. CCNWLW203 TaxID=3112842 RepID=UPI002F966AF1